MCSIIMARSGSLDRVPRWKAYGLVSSEVWAVGSNEIIAIGAKES